MAVAGTRRQLQRQHLVAFGDGLAVQRQQHVARLDAGAGGRGVFRDFRGDDTGGALEPQHTIFDIVRRRALCNICNPHHQQQQRRDDRQNRALPVAPAWRRG
jgi:hypothetical protein